MRHTIDIRYFCLVGILLVGAAGCVSLEAEQEITIDAARKEPVRQGVYHKVKRGETLWRIAKTYGVALDEIIEANNIPKEAKLEQGQLILVPGATQTRDIILDTGQNEKEFIWPVKGKVIKFFHERYGNELNQGIDIQARVGDDVRASRTGRVVFADYLSGYGYTVILDHEDGFHSVYANNAKLLVRVGETAPKNSVLARVGHNGNLASIHFQIRNRSIESNPLHYLP